MSKLKKVPKKYQGKEIYSISKLQNFRQCPFQYYLQYIKKLEGKDNIYSETGSFCHENLVLLQKGKTNKDQVATAFKEKLIEFLEIRNLRFPTEKSQNNFIENVYEYFKYYKPINAKELLLEKEFYTNIKRKIFRGFVDVIAYLDKDTVDIYDYKTSNKYSPADIEKSYRYQLLLYAYAVEKKHKVKVNSIKWNFLKYATVEYEVELKKGIVWKSKTVARNEIVSTFKEQMQEQLSVLGIPEIEQEILLGNNEIPVLLESKYKISDCIVEYPWNEKTKQDLIDYVMGIIGEVESKKDEADFPPVELSEKTTFFCNVLCSFGGGKEAICPHLKKYLEDKEKSENKETSELEELFG